MQNYAYQMSLLLVEIGRDTTEHSKLLISNIQSLVSQLKGAARYLQAKRLIKERKMWLSVVEDVAPYAYASQCNRKIKFLFWVATTPIVRMFVIALILLPVFVYLFPLSVFHGGVSLRQRLYRGFLKLRKGKKTVVYSGFHEDEGEIDKETMVRAAVATNSNTSPEALSLLAHDDDEFVRKAVAENGNTPAEVLASLAQGGVIRELKASGVAVDTRKGMLYLISGYEANSLYPFKKFLAEEGLDDQDFVIFTNNTSLAVVFQNTNSHYPLYAIHGSAVVDKDKEIEIYREVYENFIDMEGRLSQFKYKGVPVASFMLTSFFTSAAIAAAANEVYEYCRSNNQKNIVFITAGTNIFLESMLRSMCEEDCNNLNEFHSWRILQVYDSYQDIRFEYENPERRAQHRNQTFSFRDVDSRSKRLWSDKRSEKILARIDRAIAGKSPIKKARALFHEVYNSFYYLSATINYCGKQSEAASVFVVTEADPKSIYWKAVYPVIQSVRAKGGKIVVFTGNYSVYVKMRSENIEAFLLSYNVKLPPNLEFNRAGNKLFMELSSYLKFELTSEGGEDYKYFNQSDSYKMFSEIKDLAGLYGSFQTSMMLIDLLDRAFNVYKPRSVLTMPHASPGPAHAIDIARLRGVKSVSMPAVTVDSNRRSIPTNWKTDFIASYGEQSNRAFLDTGHPEESLVLTGNASLDTLLKHELDVSEAEVRARLGISEDMKIVLIASSRIDTREEIWLNEMHDHCERRGDAVMVIKSHPSFDPSSYDKVRRGKHCIVLDDIPIYSLIYASTLLVTDYSTTGVEAALVGKPVVVVNLLGKDYPSNNYDQYGVALLIDELSGVGAALDPILDGDEEVIAKLEAAQAKFVDDYNYRNDGHAADRIADILLNPEKYTQKASEGSRTPIGNLEVEPSY